ncbi:MAG: glycosyltransferase [Vicinamibacterales bacterium]
MTAPEILSSEVQDRLAALGTVDLLVGIPSYNNAATIGHVVRAVSAGFAKYFPGKHAVCVNSDGGSRDGTPQIVAEASFSTPESLLVRHRLSPVHKILTPYHGIPGKGSAFRTIFSIASRLRAKACAVVDSDLRSITPEWIELLLGPVLEHGFDYVAPLYLRHKYDGTITNSIVYPLTRALYGIDVRQPIGGDFGFSGRLAEHYLSQPVWESNVARFGIDIWMTTTAIAEGFAVCQAFLGAKLHDAKDPGADLAEMLVQVVSSVFDLMGTYEERWKATRTTTSVPLFGFPHGVGLEPVSVDVERMVTVFRQATRDLREIWELTLTPETFAQVVELAARESAGFRFPPSLWVQVVYDFAVAYRRPRIPPPQLLRSLVPLYLGRTASFVLETADTDAAGVERIIRQLADEFVEQKAYLVGRWNARSHAERE